MANEVNQGQRSGGQQQKENFSGQQQPGQKKPNESGEQGSQGNEQQRRTPGREQEQANEQRRGAGEGQKDKAGNERKRAYVKIRPSEMGREMKHENPRWIQVRASGSAQNVVEAPTMLACTMRR